MRTLTLPLPLPLPLPLTLTLTLTLTRCDQRDAQLFEAQQGRHGLEVQLRHELSALQMQVRASVPLSQLEKLTAKVNEHARRSTEAHKEVRTSQGQAEG